LRGYPCWTAGRARALSAVALALLLAACGAGDNDPGPGGVTVGEARALDEAAEMLDAQQLPEGALPSETPAAEPDATAAAADDKAPPATE
jgi:hypothetical protein